MPADLPALLHAAVGGVGGSDRPGQTRMAQAVADAIADDTHLLVQAGTGTGKSLAYLVPAIQHACSKGRPVIVATATLALQAQIVDRDLPRLAEALRPLIGRRPTFEIVKGRRNYLCKHKLYGGYPDEEEDSLLGVGQVDQQLGRLEREIKRLREWADETQTGERDELVPGVSERAWRQVSVSAHECLGAKCPTYGECFVEQSRARAKEVDVVVTNHSFMAIDSFEGRHMLPEHDVLIVDEAHELVDRVTSTITDEVSAGMVNAAVRRCGRLAETAMLGEAGDFLGQVLQPLAEGRLLGLPDSVALALQRVLASGGTVQEELKPEKGQENDGPRQVARAAIDELVENTARILEERELDVVWLSQDPRRGPALRVAPMSVAMLLRDKVFGERTVVMTSATLELGGTFDAVAGQLGLRGEDGPKWSGLDVGSPFDYPQQAIAYVAQHLPAPGRDGLAPVALDEIEALVRAAGGRTLGLFSSTRAAKAAAEEMRIRLGDEIPVLCQGDDQTGTLIKAFAADARTCLFGTMSLWQGVDVPGSACQLVLIDRIPFPRPDDPLSSARSQAIAQMGGNGFMAVSATHAALRLAQGAGRLIRRSSDRGVVAFLDSRMMTARYAGFLQRSLPPFWPTTDRALVLNALRRLDQIAPPVVDLDAAPPSGPAPATFAKVAASVSSEEAASYARVGEAIVEDADVSPAVEAELDQAETHDPDAEPGPVGADTATPAPAGDDATGWTAEDDEELRDGLELGLEPAELADHLDRPEEQVRERLKALELS